ncbi:cobalamin biosynthesis central domain-containing protein [Halorhodospira halophila]|uniref:Cobalamin (Vitamin B12) biosynthesis CbiG protein n=1 Tax=Halorhodospira halophila (strain DSM 244 / SL1) TaxID=349124 RepID=A1WWQ1_HALHL|nr:cobalamin biosynthesis central domain-containing protein [Halorhodospira halophila]ABM62113.1 cobalamin (vitamin B12) biosynthesis CbiG protein [Halorhodospira halophila SL1]
MRETGEGVLLVVVTRGGAASAARLAGIWPEAEILVTERVAPLLADHSGRCTPVAAGALGSALAERFAGALRQVVCFCSVGACVRLLAPLLVDKTRDPGVVSVDESARFVVAVLGGHLGGANAWTQRIAEELGAAPVITTASDRRGLPAVDLLGQEQGWQVVASTSALRAAAAALLNGEPVALIEEADTWRPATPPPPNLYRLDDPAALDARAYSAVLWVKDEAPSVDWQARLGDRLVRYRTAHPGS